MWKLRSILINFKILLNSFRILHVVLLDLIIKIKYVVGMNRKYASNSLTILKSHCSIVQFLELYDYLECFHKKMHGGWCWLSSMYISRKFCGVPKDRSLLEAMCACSSLSSGRWDREGWERMKLNWAGIGTWLCVANNYLLALVFMTLIAQPYHLDIYL